VLFIQRENDGVPGVAAGGVGAVGDTLWNNGVSSTPGYRGVAYRGRRSSGAAAYGRHRGVRRAGVAEEWQYGPAERDTDGEIVRRQIEDRKFHLCCEIRTGVTNSKPHRRICFASKESTGSMPMHLKLYNFEQTELKDFRYRF
jgi:hypothetical protein